MPFAAVAPYVIPAAASLLGALFGRSSSNRASQAQTQASDAAIAFQREESAKEEARYQQYLMQTAMAQNDYNRTRGPANRRQASLLGIDYVAPAPITLGSYANQGASYGAPAQYGLGQMSGYGAQSRDYGQIEGGNVTAPMPSTLGGLSMPEGPFNNPTLWR